MTEKKYYLIDASKRPLGRIATRVSTLLRGKNSPDFKPNICPSNIVIVINAASVNLSGSKSLSKNYKHYTGYHGGIRTKTFSSLKKENPKEIVIHAVKGMLPKNRLTRCFLLNLKIYASENHPYEKEKVIKVED